MRVCPGHDVLLYVLVCTAAAACGARQTGPVVADVEIEGADAVDADDVIAGLSTRPPDGFLFKRYQKYDQVALELDLARVVAFYQRRGHFSTKVFTEDVSVDGDDVSVRLRVVEGEATRLRTVELRGTAAVATELAQPSLGDLAAGARYDEADYLRARDVLAVWLRRAGYPWGRVRGEVEVDATARRADVALTVEPGPVGKFGGTELRGLRAVPASVVRERIPWQAGQKFEPRLVELLRGRLYGLDRFSLARLHYPSSQSDDGEVRMTIDLVEAPRNRLKLGAGVAVDRTAWEVRARAEYSVRGIVDPRLTLRIQARPAYQFLRTSTDSDGFGGEASVLLERIDFIAPLLTLSVGGSYDLVELEAYSIQGPEVSVGLDRFFWDDHLQLRGGWRARFLDLFDRHAAIPATLADEIGLRGEYRLGFFEQAAVLDFRDRPLDATTGVYAAGTVEEAGDFAGGRFSYLRGMVDVRGYYPLHDRLVIAARGRLGGKLSGTLPVTQRFFSGGASDHRGFARRELSPRVTDPNDGDIEYGGNVLFEWSAEARLRLVRVAGSWLGLVLFSDAGDVPDPGRAVDLFDLHWAAGAGVRYDTAIGPIRFDVAYRLNRFGSGEPADGERFAFHFSLGQAF